MSAIQKAIKQAGSPANLARALGVLPQHINNWVKRGVPAKVCIPIEEATGITRYELRPDIFGKNENKNH